MEAELLQALLQHHNFCPKNTNFPCQKDAQPLLSFQFCWVSYTYIKP